MTHAILITYFLFYNMHGALVMTHAKVNVPDLALCKKIAYRLNIMPATPPNVATFSFCVESH